MTSSLLDLTGAKQQVNVTDNQNDGEMELYVDAAVDLVEGLIGPVDQRPATQTFATGGLGPWLLNVTPVTAITAASAAGAAVELSALALDAASAIVRATRPLDGPVVLTLTVGRYPAGSTPPAAMRLAARTIFAHLWATQRGSGSRSRGGADEDVALGGMAWAVPNRAADLLRPWLLAPALA